MSTHGMSKARDLANLLKASGDVKTEHLDEVDAPSTATVLQIAQDSYIEDELLDLGWSN